MKIEQLAKDLNINRNKLSSHADRKHLFLEEYTNNLLLKKVLKQLLVNLLKIELETHITYKLILLKKSGFKRFEEGLCNSYKSMCWVDNAGKYIEKHKKDEFNEKLLFYINSVSRFLVDRYEA